MVAGLQIEDSGGGGVPLLCLHGIGGDIESFRPQFEAFGAQRRVIAWCMPGYGRSQPLSTLSFQTLVAALRELLEVLGVDAVHLLGQSIGGMIAQAFALAHPGRVASLVLVATTAAFGGRDDSFKRQFLQARMAPLDAGETMPALAERFVPEIVGPVASRDAIAAAVRSMSAVPESSYRDTLACLVQFDVRDRLVQIRCPALLIAGSHDRNAPTRTMQKMADRLPDARCEEIAGAGHLINLEAPAAVEPLIRAFLHTVESRADV